MVKLYTIICNDELTNQSYVYYISTNEKSIKKMLNQTHYDLLRGKTLTLYEIDSASMSKEIFEWLKTIQKY